MFGWDFRHDLIKKYVILFGNFFNDITITRIDNNNNRIQSIGVPIEYGPKEHYLARVGVDPNLNRSIAVSLPRMSFELVGMDYDGDRKLPSTHKNFALASSNDQLKIQYTPTPYNFSFDLNVMVSNAADGAQIVEQILPWFKPEWTATLRLIPEMSINMDISTIIQSASVQDTYESDFISRRALVWNLSFMMKGYLFGPVQKKGVIKRAQIDSIVLPGANPITPEEMANHGRSERLVMTPGLLANGSPTTNSAASIPYSQITANDNFGFASNTFFFQDGLKYSPSKGIDVRIK